MSAVHQNTSSSRRSNTILVVYAAYVRYPPVVCRIPFGLPVVPLVYSVNSVCSLSNASAACRGDAVSTDSCHHTSRACHEIGLEHRRTTSTLSTPVPSTALSTLSLSGTICPRRQLPSAVITSLAPASTIRSRSASAENPPN